MLTKQLLELQNTLPAHNSAKGIFFHQQKVIKLFFPFGIGKGELGSNLIESSNIS